MKSNDRDLLPYGRVRGFMFDGLAIAALLLIAAGRLAADPLPATLPESPSVTAPATPSVTAPAIPPVTAPTTSVTGRLIVEGDAVEHVFLGKVEAGGRVDPKKAIVLRRPNWHVPIPAGPYIVLRIDLKGGYIHAAPLAIVDGKIQVPREAERLTIRPDKPCMLKIDLPLKPRLLGGRRGRIIQILYGLYDAQSRYYIGKPQEKPPQFTVSCNGKEVGSGTLQYGKGGIYAGSWHVPFSVFAGPLSIVASANLGEGGHDQSQPMSVEWHWYDQLSSFAGWALIGILLLLVKENRNREAPTILIPFVLLSEILWPWIAYFLALLSVDTSQVSDPYQWLLVTWTALWLISPWLARFRPALAIGVALPLAVAVGVGAEFWLSQRLAFSPVLMNYTILIVTLLLAFVLSGMCCRRKYSPQRFLLLLGPWLILGVFLGAICELVWMYVYGYGRVTLPPITDLLPGLLVSSLCFAGMLYLFSLPYMYLAIHSPLYRERFHTILGLPEYVLPVKAPPEADPGDENAAA